MESAPLKAIGGGATRRRDRISTCPWPRERAQPRGYDAAKQDVGHRYDLYLDMRGLALPGDRTRPFLAQVSGLGHRNADDGGAVIAGTVRGPAQQGLTIIPMGAGQYVSYTYQAVRQIWEIQPSMSHTANCGNNAVIESFFASLHAELVHYNRFGSFVEALTQIVHDAEAFNNRKRLHSSLGYLNDIAYEALPRPDVNSASTLLEVDQHDN